MRIAIDLGGTSVRVAQVDGGRIVKSIVGKCPAKGTAEEVIDLLKALIERFVTEDTDMIGIGVPSVVDAKEGIVYNAVNIPSWKEVHLKGILEEAFNIRTCVDNDVNCFVLGEKHFGAGRPFSDVVGITLGTGVGAGIIAGGRLYRGANTGAGEVGSLPYLESDYEHYCSGLFTQARTGLNGRELAQKANDGDEEAIKVWHELGFHTGKLLQALILTYDPEAIIIGGGIAAMAPLFEKDMQRSLHNGFPYPHSVERVKILFSSLKGANLLGASQL